MFQLVLSEESAKDGEEKHQELPDIGFPGFFAVGV
jgi:hypothetical protein